MYAVTRFTTQSRHTYGVCVCMHTPKIRNIDLFFGQIVILYIISVSQNKMRNKINPLKSESGLVKK